MKLSGTSRLELTLQRNSKDGQFVVHIVNYSGQNNNAYFEPIPHHGLRLGVRDVSARSGISLSTGASLRLGPVDAEGYQWVELPPIDYMEVVTFPADGSPYLGAFILVGEP